MYRFAYNIPFSELVLLLAIFCLIWCFMKDQMNGRKPLLWKLSQCFLLIICLMLFLYVSLLRQTNTLEPQWPQIFWSYRLAFLKGSYDHFQEIYLNILSFFFISLFASELFCTRRGKVVAFFACVALSISVECTQYIFSLGLAEADDIISNVLGSLFGVLFNVYGYWLYRATIQVIKKWKNRKR